jgi:hypothetical protein
VWVKRLRRMIEKNKCEISGIVLRKYPDFVWNDRVTNLYRIPVFVFHDVSQQFLRPMFQFLSDNGYNTLTANEYVERRGWSQKREVLLTFDDGKKSLYTTAFPVLKQYGLKAVAYIVPGMVSEVEDPDSPEPLRSLCNWRQIREMHESGTVDVQSHSMFHHSVAISEQVFSFFRPGVDFAFTTSDIAPLIEEEGRMRRSYEISYGTPIHNWAPRFSTAPAFQENPEVVWDCVEHVNIYGGPDYFLSSNWHQRLKTTLAASRSKHLEGRFETEEEQRTAILRDLVGSKCEIERRLPGKTVQHLAYPWFHGSPLTIQLSLKAGYISNAWDSLLPKFVRDNQIPFPITRLAPMYIMRLPGQGRKPILEILRSRFSQITSNAVHRHRLSWYL